MKSPRHQKLAIAEPFSDGGVTNISTVIKGLIDSNAIAVAFTDYQSPHMRVAQK